MKTTEIKGSLRKDLGKKASKGARKNEEVPCVLYGGSENIRFNVPTKSLKDVVYTPYVYLISLDIDGSKHKAIVKDLQFHPVSDSILHVDFLEVLANKPVVVKLPVKVVGNSAGIKKGGKLRIAKRTLKVKGDIEKMPEVIEVDITDLDVSQSIAVEDIKIENGILVDAAKALVVAVMPSRTTQKANEQTGKK